MNVPSRSREIAELARARLAALKAASPRIGPRRGEIASESEQDASNLLDVRRRFQLKHLVVLVIALIVALMLTWWWMGTTPTNTVPIKSSAPIVTSESTQTQRPSQTASAAPSQAPGLLVHVIGEVVTPGVVELPAGARVQAAIASAGGFTSKADPASLNLAAKVHDGDQIVIGTKEKPRGEHRSAGGGSTTGPGKVSLNSATQQQLETLPGVGPATAKAILSWRATHGRFTRIQELQEVDGIGPKTFAKLAPMLEI